MECAAQVDELNFLAARLETLDAAGIAALNAATQRKNGFENIGQLIDFTYNEDFFVHIPEVHNPRELGDYYLNKSGMVQMPAEWKNSIDPIAFGRNAAAQEKGSFTMYMEGHWFLCKIREEDLAAVADDPVKSLDVSLLHDLLLHPVLGIGDPKTDGRIDFVGGIRGMDELVRRCEEDCSVAFAMYPTSITELFSVADAGKLMPPKSTWFEPKLRSGLFIHSLE